MPTVPVMRGAYRWYFRHVLPRLGRAIAASMEEVFGEAPLYIREGGSVPAAATFGRVLDTPVVMLGFVQPDCQLHAPNESMRLDNFERGVLTLARYWQRLSEAGIQADAHRGY